MEELPPVVDAVAPTDRHLNSLLDHLGIGHSGADETTCMELMNVTLQCLGGLRVLMVREENKRRATQAASDNLSRHAAGAVEGSESSVEAVHSTFVLAVQRMLAAAVAGDDLDDLDPMRHLVESFPNDAGIGTPQWLAIHWAVCAPGSIGTSASSFTSTPPSASAAGNVDVARQVRVVHALAQGHPTMVNEMDKEGRSILHYASRRNSVALVDCVMQYASKSGFGPEHANGNGAFPLHNVARFSSSKRVADAVLKLSPRVIAVGNNDGTLPLHWAAAKNTDLELVNALIAAHPEAVTTANHEGYTPLHSAGQNTRLHIVKAVYDAHPPSIALRDTEGGVPLHHASCFNSNLDVVKFLYAAYPEGVMVVQVDGLTPLHLAASQNGSMEVMKFLIAVHPAAARVVDSHGWLPLHCLLNRHRDEMTASRIASLRMLLAVNPEAVAAPRNDGVTALDMARSADHRDLIVRLMLLAHPAADPPALAVLNWASARGRAVEACLHLHRTKCGQPVDTAEALCYIVRKLCDGSCASGLAIKHPVLQHILKFL